ncbi:MAG: glycoside hydrolase family 78 protein [Defluviitaleaceae bacterium]|nr:glycoside hydrolase family 78 protein [Defluviitaleaceae bacterium]
MYKNAKWIKPSRHFGDVCPAFVKKFELADVGIVNQATMTVTAAGVYEAYLNGNRVGDYILAPGWTSAKRLQCQEYTITELLQENNTLIITVGKGWYASPIPGWLNDDEKLARQNLTCGIIANIAINGIETIKTDATWRVQESPVRFSELYDGEYYDATIANTALEPVQEYAGLETKFVPQQGEKICEIDRLIPCEIITTPKNERVIDFGQNLTGYIQLNLPKSTKNGDKIQVSFAEVLDKDGNFYNANYRGAKSLLTYVCCGGEQSYKPKFTFFGFRYARLDEFPENLATENLADIFTAISVHSDMNRTGWLESANPLLNRLFENVVWGQKGNFLDIPTDCPQRDERLGWTGDAQVFVKTATYNFDVEKFFTKWLADLALEQLPNGAVQHVIPDAMNGAAGSAAWGDAATICPWQIYLTYGNKAILANQYDSMCKWVHFIKTSTKEQFLWIGGTHYGDWLSLDKSEDGAHNSTTRHDFIASAFYVHSLEITIKTGKVLGKKTVKHEHLHQNAIKAFREKFPTYNTQTEHVLAVQFNLSDNPQQTADDLAKKIIQDGSQLKTGFVGTPYLLHVLSRYGHADLAYTLLLREEYPSWLYPVTKGATTIWERWDSIKPNGDMQTTDMNSFNHYAYGAVADWVYSVAAGIQTIEDFPGFAKVRIAPQPDERLGWLSAKLETKHGTISVKWQYISGKLRYDILTPVPAEVVIGKQNYSVEKGSYTFWQAK